MIYNNWKLKWDKKKITSLAIGDNVSPIEGTILEELKSKIDTVDAKLNQLQNVLDQIADVPATDYQKVNGWTLKAYTDLAALNTYRSFARTLPVIDGYICVATKIQKWDYNNKINNEFAGEFYIILQKLYKASTTYEKLEYIKMNTSSSTLCAGINNPFDPDTYKLAADEIMLKCEYNGAYGSNYYAPPKLVFDYGTAGNSYGYYSNDSRRYINSGTNFFFCY